MRKFLDIHYGEHEMQQLDLWLPEEESFDLFVYFHGGGIETGCRKVDPSLPEYLTTRSVGLCSVEYRMFPEAKYPDFIRDCAASVAFIKEHIGEYGSCKRIFVGGSSAGGYLSMMLCFDKSWFAEVGVDPMDVAGYFHDAGQPTAHFNVLKYRGVDSRRIIVDESAPLYHIGIEPEYPPMRLTVSDKDMANRLEQTELVISTLRHFGYDMEKVSLDIRHGTHCHYTYPEQRNEKGESLFGEMIYNFVAWVDSLKS